MPPAAVITSACASLHRVRVLPRVGLHQCPSEKIRPREPACLAVGPSCLTSPTIDRAPRKRGTFRAQPRCPTGETDSLLEQAGYELPVPPATMSFLFAENTR